MRQREGKGTPRRIKPEGCCGGVVRVWLQGGTYEGNGKAGEAVGPVPEGLEAKLRGVGFILEVQGAMEGFRPVLPFRKN